MCTINEVGVKCKSKRPIDDIVMSEIHVYKYVLQLTANNLN